MDEIEFAYKLYPEVGVANIISQVANVTGCRVYLELGVMTGDTIREVSRYVPRCIGVDVVDVFLFRDFEFHIMTTDDFFSTFKDHPDIIFIDADHHFEQVKKDFENSLRCIGDHGIIFLHDTDPARQEFLNQGGCGDAYRMHDWIRSSHPELDIVTLPVTLAGLSIVNRRNDRRVLKFNNTN